jgi:hypothetical protein
MAIERTSIQASVWLTCNSHLDFFHQEARSAAQPQPRLGLSPAKSQRPQRSKKNVKIIRKNIIFPL